MAITNITVVKIVMDVTITVINEMIEIKVIKKTLRMSSLSGPSWTQQIITVVKPSMDIKYFTYTTYITFISAIMDIPYNTVIKAIMDVIVIKLMKVKSS